MDVKKRNESQEIITLNGKGDIGHKRRHNTTTPNILRFWPYMGNGHACPFKCKPIDLATDTTIVGEFKLT